MKVCWSGWSFVGVNCEYDGRNVQKAAPRYNYYHRFNNREDAFFWTKRNMNSGIPECHWTALHCVCVCFQWFNAPLTRTTRKGGWRKGIYVAVGFSDGKLNYHLVLFRVQNVNSINLDNVQHMVPPTTVNHIKVNQCVW